ncbi:MAG: hypothetical protein AMJ53_12680 [Gammaproteobacteria bacterium SG8_11]|nr:MAG: hypothetical protein AMJ53_12680 [Gammaproteobacteria bacterium SG8_11]
MGKSSSVVYIKEQQSSERAVRKYKFGSELWRNMKSAPNQEKVRGVWGNGKPGPRPKQFQMAGCFK